MNAQKGSAVSKHKGSVQMTKTTRRQRGPMPTVTFDGSTYCLRSRKTVVPDLSAMTRIDALAWLCGHTTGRGYSRPNPLAGFAGAIQVR